MNFSPWNVNRDGHLLSDEDIKRIRTFMDEQRGRIMREFMDVANMPPDMPQDIFRKGNKSGFSATGRVVAHGTGRYSRSPDNIPRDGILKMRNMVKVDLDDVMLQHHSDDLFSTIVKKYADDSLAQTIAEIHGAESHSGPKGPDGASRAFRLGQAPERRRINHDGTIDVSDIPPGTSVDIEYHSYQLDAQRSSVMSTVNAQAMARMMERRVRSKTAVWSADRRDRAATPKTKRAALRKKSAAQKKARKKQRS